MTRSRIHFFFLNLGHFYDHMLMLLFATVAALALEREWGLGYAQLIPYSVAGFVAFGVGAVPAGWLADRWSRPGLMLVFFIGIGASSVLTGLANTPFQIGAGLFAVGVFASIYHPVGVAMVVEGRRKMGLVLGINGIFGNMGVAAAPLLAGILIDLTHWRWAFVAPGFLAILTGIGYALLRQKEPWAPAQTSAAQGKDRAKEGVALERGLLLWVFLIVFSSTACGSLIFQTTTFSLPKVFDERLANLAANATQVGFWTSIALALAAFAQLPVGMLVDRHSLRTIFAVVAGLQVPLFLIIIPLSGVSVFFAAVAVMLLVFGQIPINDALLARITKSEWRSRAFGLKYILTFTISAITIPLIALLHSSGGFAALFGVAAGVATLMFCVVLFLPRAAAEPQVLLPAGGD